MSSVGFGGARNAVDARSRPARLGSVGPMSSYFRRLPTTVAVPAVGSLLAIVVAGALSPDPGTAQASRPAVGIGPAATHTLTLLLTSAVIAALIATVVALAARRLPIIGVLVAAADRVLPMVIVAMSAVAVSVGRGSPVHPVVLAAILAVPAGVALAARLADALSGELRRTSATMARMLCIGPRRLLLRRKAATLGLPLTSLPFPVRRSSMIRNCRSPFWKPIETPRSKLYRPFRARKRSSSPLNSSI